MNKLLLLCAFVCISLTAMGQYKPGDRATDFRLKNVDGALVSLKDDKAAKGFIVVFTCNHCPYSQAYEQRIIALDQKYRPLGYPVVAINPNDPQLQPEDSFDKMVERARDKAYPFPYLLDESQNVARTYGATRTPHVFVLERQKNRLVVRYIGAIDDHTEDADKAEKKYVEAAVEALLSGQQPTLAITKAIGCTIKWKKG